ncbi:hypothetical protein D9756_006548 [Leucocoprinus leucothites]|uniref:Uncharacterized protein n=1 Tax=Leucocoprinus leucothites TaxID=201217 RepID=A0A8H5G2G8_9AGAR|nr:hypothetical protein D9756_006548 [Leucoagaricus leucothites]
MAYSHNDTTKPIPGAYQDNYSDQQAQPPQQQPRGGGGYVPSGIGSSGYEYGTSGNTGGPPPPPPGYATGQPERMQNTRGDVYYDYGMQMCSRGHHDWRSEYGLGGILCAIVRVFFS